MKWAVMLVAVTLLIYVLQPRQLSEPKEVALAMFVGIWMGLWVIRSYLRGAFRLTFGTFPRKSSPVVFWLCVVSYGLISLLFLAAALVRGVR